MGAEILDTGRFRFRGGFDRALTPMLVLLALLATAIVDACAQPADDIHFRTGRPHVEPVWLTSVSSA
jgi:hypothetical protein